MADFTLVIGNRNCSSWSLRAWLVARASGLDFATELVRLGPPDRSVGLAAVGLMPTALAGRGDDEPGASRPAHISTCAMEAKGNKRREYSGATVRSRPSPR